MCFAMGSELVGIQGSKLGFVRLQLKPPSSELSFKLYEGYTGFRKPVCLRI